MPEVLYSAKYTWRKSDIPHIETAYALITALVEKTPDWKGPNRRLDASLIERKDGTATLSVKVVGTDTEKQPWSRGEENLRVAICLIAIAIISLVIAIW